MFNKIISISGRPGLYRLVSQGRNMLIVESLADGRRFPAYARDRVISLADVSMFTNDGDVPLGDVLTAAFEKTEGQPVDFKSLEKEGKLRDFFGEILPDFDRDRVRDTDIRKLFQWYNQLIAAGVTRFKNDEIAEDQAAEAAEAADDQEKESK
ncbi:MAG: DUF5606 domain-containing protein [Clostridium sp.]|nr:DUF5606 domain-containing protein [Clostridium sp.]